LSYLNPFEHQEIIETFCEKIVFLQKISPLSFGPPQKYQKHGILGEAERRQALETKIIF
jgi:hypothetical protein